MRLPKIVSFVFRRRGATLPFKCWRALDHETLGWCSFRNRRAAEKQKKMLKAAFASINRPPLRGLEQTQTRANLRQRPASIWSLKLGAFLGVGCWCLEFLVLVFATIPLRAETLPQPQYQPVTSGLDYAHIQTTNPWSIHIVRWDRTHKEFELRSTLARGTIQGLSTVAEQAKAMSTQIGHPLAGVNGDFFVIKAGPYQGDPQGLQILNGELVSAPASASFWAMPRDVHIGKIQSALKVIWPDGRAIPIGLNQEPHTNTAILFTPTFGESTRATNRTELVLENAGSKNWLPLHASESFRARVRSINSCGNSPLTPEIMVLTLGEKLTNRLASVPIGSLLQISTTSSENLTGTITALGGGPLLVHNGKPQSWPTTKGTNTNALPRHPRTAIGFSKNYFFLVEVDGRQNELSIGMNYPELAGLMKSLGCTDAMNMDGGGSSTFWLDGKVMNSPSDKHERATANALFIVRNGNQ
jgi:hypothetical protein